MNLEDVHKSLSVILTQLKCSYISGEKGSYSTEVRYKIEEQLKEKNIEI